MSKPTSDCRATERKHPWPMVRLGDVCEDKIQRIKSIRESRIAYIDISSIDNVQKRVVGAKEYDVDDAPGRAQQVVIPGDVLVSNVRPNLNAVAIVDVASAIPLIASTGFCVLRVKDSVLPKYVYYYAQTSDFIDPLVAVSEKASYPSVTDTIVKDSLVSFPPLPVQREIVARLERELAAVEKMKKGFEALAETVKAEFKAELKEVFEELKSGGAGIGTDGTNGTHGTVETRRLGEIGRVVTGTTPSKGNKSYYGGEWPFYKPADLNQGRNTIGSGDSLTDAGWQSARQLPANSVLVTCIGATLGKTGIIRREGSCNQQINAIVCDGKALPEYVYYSILSPQFQNMLWQASNSTTLPMVNKSTFEKFEIPFPALAVQREVVARLDAAKARAEKLEAKAREGMAVCETMRKAILKEAFEGID